MRTLTVHSTFKGVCEWHSKDYVGGEPDLALLCGLVPGPVCLDGCRMCLQHIVAGTAGQTPRQKLGSQLLVNWL